MQLAMKAADHAADHEGGCLETEAFAWVPAGPAAIALKLTYSHMCYVRTGTMRLYLPVRIVPVRRYNRT